MARRWHLSLRGEKRMTWEVRLKNRMDLEGTQNLEFISDQGRGTGKVSVRKVKAKESGGHCRRISQVVKTQDCRHLWTVWWFLLGHSA